MNKRALIIVAVIVMAILSVELIPSNAPEIIYVRVTQSNNQTPETNALCKADIIAGDYSVEDKQLEKVEEFITDCFTENCASQINRTKGFYKLETGFENYPGKFEIKIVCITSSGVSYTILNNTYIPCEVIDNGKSMRC